MTIAKLLTICLCCMVVVPAAWGQTAGMSKSGVLGFLDPQTGAFRVAPTASEESPDANAQTAFTGTITLTITITLKTAGLTNISCTEQVSALDGTTSPRFFTESNTVAATGSGATRTCKLSIPYSWALTNQATDSMTTSYAVVGVTGATGLPQRTSSLNPFDTRKVPANGATTALTAAVTL